jgi:DNA helicase II / ATP-dependent DNA helicase PcrA
MRLVADLHVHSRYSRATSREADLAGYHRWARVKGIDIVGTGDFTHPRWFEELSGSLREQDGLYVLKDPPRDSPREGCTPADRTVRFILTTEISSIYKKQGAVRKVHSLIGVPSLDAAHRFAAKLARIGNIASDGRPILGLDPKDLLSMLLECDEDAFLIPAHIWTPWFSIFGSRSGFDRIEDCFEELTPRIFALETGLSSDPSMNWRWSALDRYRLVSNSDAHSPGNLGREANLLDTEPTWRGVLDALRTGRGFLGTFEFYPEEGKYHFDGHRKCGICWDPARSRDAGGLCPVCGKPLTIGVLNRVMALADRSVPLPPRTGEDFRYIIPLPELLSELAGAGVGSRAVTALHARIVSAYGSEYGFLLEATLQDIERSHGALLSEAVRRMREGRIDARPGYDGEFGVITVFDDDELRRLRGQDSLFPAVRRAGHRPSAGTAAWGRAAPAAEGRKSVQPAPTAGDSLDEEQRAIARSASPRIVVSAGPGSGKTRLLVHWLAETARRRGPEAGILALTFTTRAAAEMSERLAGIAPDCAAGMTVATFHSFCWSILREHDLRLRGIVTPSRRRAHLSMLFPGVPPARILSLSREMERAWEGKEEAPPDLGVAMEAYDRELARTACVDVACLVGRLVGLLQSDAGFCSSVRGRFSVIAVDELQDINPPQFELLRILGAAASAVLCIGDPDQAIYGFRGSDRALFSRFQELSSADSFSLTRNYRSTARIVEASASVISMDRAPGSPALSAVRPPGDSIRVVGVHDPEEEGRFIAAEIRGLVGGVDSVSVDAVRERDIQGYAFSDIAVLFRTRAVRDALLPSLQQAGLPLSAASNAPLAEEEPFDALLAALYLAADPHDEVALHILRQHEKRTGEPGAADAVLQHAAALSEAAAGVGICAALDLIIQAAIPLDRSQPDVALGEETIRSSAARFGCDLRGFLAHVSLCARESETPRAGQKVTLLTFHAAKGLEFPVVFIAGAEEGITPLPDDPAEERRLFYVAMTRAKDLLYITHCARRRVYGQVRDSRPSRFIGDIPEEHLLRGAGQRTPGRKSRQLTLF